MSGDCDPIQFRNNRGLQDEKNAKLSVPTEVTLKKPEGGQRITPQGSKSWEASAQDHSSEPIYCERQKCHTAERVAFLL
jgi:hypothetical protein